MTPSPLPPACQEALASIQSLQQQAGWQSAALLLATHLEALLGHCAEIVLAELLTHFPADVLNQTPDLHYVQGMLHTKAGRLNEAINLLERAKFSYRISQHNFDQAARCCLEIVRIYLSREHFAVAYHYLIDELQPLIEQGVIHNPQIRARFCLRMAEITPDIGKLQESLRYAQEALALYQAANDIPGQFYALVRLASASAHVGDYEQAASYLEMAKTYHTLGNLGQLEQARLLNLVIHLRWYVGNLETALQQAHQYCALVDGEEYSNFRVYARMLLGNLQRGLGEFAAAESWYGEARRLASQLNYERYLPWIDVQTAWLRILQNRLDEARALVYTSLKTSDLGQAMSFQLFLAVVELLEHQYHAAERLLRESFAFYEKSGDALTLCAIRFHLAYAALQEDHLAQAQPILAAALTWLAQRRLDYFPHWWHPTILSTVCAYALAQDLYPEIVERIFIYHLKQAGVPALRALLHAQHLETHTRAYHLLRLLDGEVFDELAHFPAGKGKQILTELLQQGLLRREGFARLQAELITADHRKTPNPTLLAVFGLYVNGYSRDVIAEKLECSVPNIRNYITLLYQQFGLDPEGFTTRRSRQQRLVEMARARGFIG